ncbi:unnamed protein product [Orchesella dallaii]|uniref:Uncharacterized protein n=1 Tax=Orchesella dallaii TaxID=48710 RepID=A0ABP1RDH7_9HEXA
MGRIVNPYNSTTRLLRQNIIDNEAFENSFSLSNGLQQDISTEVIKFLNLFRGCNFRLYMGFELEDEQYWYRYSVISLVLNGHSSFIIESKNISSDYRTTHSPINSGKAFRKFAICSTHIYLNKQINKLVMLDAISLQPDFIWILTFTVLVPNSENDNREGLYDENVHVINRLKPRNPFQSLSQLHYSATYIEILDYTRVNLICIPCTHEPTQVELRLGDYLSRFHIQKLWTQSNTNMHEQKINFNSATNIPFSEDCNIHKSSELSPKVCVITQLRKMFNYSIQANEENRHSHGSIFSGIFIGRGNINFVRYGKHLMIPSGMIADSFALIIILGHPPKNLVAVLQPFQWSTWLGIFIAASSLTTIFYFDFTYCTISVISKTVSDSDSYYEGESEQCESTDRNSEPGQLLRIIAGKAIVKVYDENATISETSRVSRLIPYRKFNQCVVLSYFSFQNTSQLAAKAGESKADFVWFLMSEQVENLNSSDYEHLVKLPFSGLVFTITKFSAVHLLCLSCNDQERAISISNQLDSEISTMEESSKEFSMIPYYYKLWKTFHHNLNQVPIFTDTDLGPSPIQRFKECNIHKKNHVMSSSCTYVVLMQHFNFSLLLTDSAKQNGILAHAYLDNGIMITPRNMIWIKSGHFQMLSYAIDIEPYAYIMVLEEPPNNFDGILYPFDLTTWSMILLVSILLTVIICIKLPSESTSKEFDHSSITSVYPERLSIVKSHTGVWYTIMVLLVDQPIADVERIASHKSVLIVLWSLWTFVALSLSQAYKCSLFSFLAQIPSVSVPHSLASLVDSGMLLGTTDSFIHVNRNGPQSKIKRNYKSTLKDIILRDMIRNNDEFGMNTSIFKRLQHSSKWLGTDFTGIAVKFITRTPFMNKHINESVNIPSNFILLDPKSYILIQSKLFDFFTANWVSDVKPLPVFVSRAVWIVKETYLRPLLENSVAALFESGIYTRWKKYYELHKTCFFLQYVYLSLAGSRQNSSGKQPGKWIYPDRVYHKIAFKRVFSYVYFNGARESFVSDTIPTKVYGMQFPIFYWNSQFKCLLCLEEMSSYVLSCLRCGASGVSVSCPWCLTRLIKEHYFHLCLLLPQLKYRPLLSSIISQRSYIATTSTISAINASGLLGTVSMLEESILAKGKDESCNSNELHEKLLEKLTWLGDDNINRLV